MDGSLVGRENDLRRFGDFLGGLPSVGGPVLLVGEPGVGKTALLGAVGHQAQEMGMRVLHTAGVQYRVHAGYGAVRQLLTSSPEIRDVSGGAPALAAVLGRESGSVPGYEAVADALLSLIIGLSDTMPTLVLLDDAHWLDRASAAVLGNLVRRLCGTGAGIVCATRPAGESRFDRAGLPIHELAPLSESASEELLARSFPALAPRVRKRLMADAEGNPLALLELPTVLTDAQRSAGQALPRRLPLNQRLQSAFAARVDGLPAATRHVLLVAALEGSGGLHIVQRAIAGKSSLKHLAPAERAGLIDIDDAAGRLTFRHSLVRSAIVDLSTSDQRRHAHRALADAWREVPEQRAWHLAQAAVDPDEEVAALLEQVADLSAARGDGPHAMDALVRAADLSPTGTEQARLLAKAAYVGANVTGDLLDVPRLLNDARHAAPGADCPTAAAATAMYLLNGFGDVDTAHRILSTAIARRPEPYDAGDSALAEAMSVLLSVCFYGGRDELWPALDDALARYPSAPEPVELIRAAFGDPARARPQDWAKLDAAIAALAETSDPVLAVKIGIAAAYSDRLGTMTEPLSRTAYGSRATDNIFPAIQALFLLANQAWFAGDWPRLRQVIGDGLELCDQFQYPMPSWPGTFLLGCANAASGELDEARSLADKMDRWACPRRAGAVRHYASHVRTLIALAEGDFETAYHQAASIAPPGTLPPHTPHALWVFLDLVEAAVRTNRREEAMNHVRAAREAGLHNVSPRLAMVVMASAALAAQDDEAAARSFEQALAVDGAERWPFDLARIRLYHGERLRRGRAAARARGHLTAAAESFVRLGALPWADRANQELRACGSLLRSAPRPDAATLTPQQREIAGLAASGLTNKQIGERLFLSPRTVSTHLYQLFPKLGVTSRAALRDALQSLGRP